MPSLLIRWGKNWVSNSWDIANIEFVWVGWGGWGLHSHYIVKPNLVLRLGWGFDNIFLFNSYNVLSSLYDAFITEMRQKLHLIVIIAGTWDMAGN